MHGLEESLRRISNLKTLILEPEPSNSSSSPQALLAFSSLVFPDGSIYTYNQQRLAHEQESKGSDIRVYDSTFVRHWDEWSPTHGEKNQVFVVRLSRNPKDFDSEDEDEESEESEDEFEVVDEREGGRWSFEREQVIVENIKKHQPKIISPMAGTKLVCFLFLSRITHFFFLNLTILVSILLGVSRWTFRLLL